MSIKNKANCRTVKALLKIMIETESMCLTC